jgi:DNA-binding transcriptional regulator YiaG
MQYKTICINGKQKRLHRYLIEQKIGRELGYNEIVHHKDRNILNNDLDNLELITRAEHMAMHTEIKDAAIRAKKKYEIDPEEIKKLYVDEGLSAKSVADRIGIPVYTINWVVREYQLKHKKSRIVCSVCGGETRYNNPPLCSKCYHQKYFRNHKGE